MIGKKLRKKQFLPWDSKNKIAVKEAVFPFKKFKGVDVLLGPEMKSTGEVMGFDTRRKTSCCRYDKKQRYCSYI